MKVGAFCCLAGTATFNLNIMREDCMQRTIFAVIVLFLGVFSRLLPHPPNFTPIAAIALFGGVYFDKRYALILPLAAMFLSDIYLGFHDLMPWVYSSFLLSGLIGLWLKHHRRPSFILGGALASSAVFFLVTNFGVWALPQPAYPHTLAGLAECYVVAIPFLRTEVLGTLAYTGILFLLYEAMVRVFVARKEGANI